MARKKRYKQKLNPMTSFDVFLYALMVILALATAFPFYYMLIISFSNYDAIHAVSVYLWPTVCDTSAYKLVFENRYFWSSVWTTIFITVVGTGLGVVLTTAAAYPLTKTKIPGYKFMMGFMIFTMFFGGGMIPSYLLIKNLHLINNVWSMILPSLIGTFNIILIKNFIEDLPESFEESAKLDGANDITILFKIILPMSKPIIATIALFVAVDKWNEYYSGLLYIIDRAKFPLQLLLRGILTDTTSNLTGSAATIVSQNKTNMGLSLQMAIVTIATVPILVVYPFVQKYFTKGIMLGGVKG